jgi:hypothetical protein
MNLIILATEAEPASMPQEESNASCHVLGIDSQADRHNIPSLLTHSTANVPKPETLVVLGSGWEEQRRRFWSN